MIYYDTLLRMKCRGKKERDTYERIAFLEIAELKPRSYTVPQLSESIRNFSSYA